MNYFIVFLALTGGNFVYSGYIYDKGLGTECLYDEDCITRNSFCKGNKICACKIGFQYDPGSDVCFPKELGLKCSEDYDCSAIENSMCNSGRCECRHDYVPSRDKSNCLPNMRLTSVCEEDAQCNSVLNRSLCDPVVGHCVCDRGLQLNNYLMRCVEKRGLPTQCMDVRDCEVNPLNKGRVECKSIREPFLVKSCYCIEGYVEREGVCYEKDGSSHAVLSLPALITLLLVKWLA